MKDIFSKFSVNFFFKIIGAILSYLITLIITKKFGVKNFGNYVLFLTYINILSLLSRGGVEIFIIKNFPLWIKRRKFFLLNKFFRSFVIFNFMSLIIITMIISLIDINKFGIYLYIGIFLYTFFIYFLETIRAFNYVKSFVFLKDVLFTSLVLVLVFLNISPIYSYIFSLLIIVLSAYILLNKNNIVNINNKIYKDFYSPLLMWTKLKFYLINSSIFLIMNWVDILMISYLMNEYNVGIYSVIAKIVMLFSLIWVSFNSFSVVRYSQLKNNKKLLFNFYVKVNFIFRMVSIILFIFIIFFGKKLLLIFDIISEKYYYVLIILSLAQLIKHLLGLNIDLINILGLHKKLMLIILVSVLINLLLNYFFIPEYGLIGAAISTFVAIVISSMGRYILVLKFFNCFRKQSYNK